MLWIKQSVSAQPSPFTELVSAYRIRSDKLTAIQRWLLSLVVTAFVIVLSYLWIDRPIALFVHVHISGHEAFAQLTRIPEPFIPLAVVTFLALGLRNLAGRPLSKNYTTALICSTSLIMADVIKNQLKFIFGRLWPETWVLNNPSFVHDGAYGFNLFHGGAGYASFPSGHTSVICAIISVLWILHPKLRALYLLLVLAITVGLIGANYHFLSDIVAGAFVGVSTGWMTTALWNARPAGGDVK
jgi:membrane-associated phospholipid phosphatase